MSVTDTLNIVMLMPNVQIFRDPIHVFAKAVILETVPTVVMLIQNQPHRQVINKTKFSVFRFLF